MIKRGGISRGVKGVADASSPFPQDTPSGVRHPADPNGLPFGIFYESHFWPIYPTVFWRRLWLQYILFLRGRLEKTPQKNVVSESKISKIA